MGPVQATGKQRAAIRKRDKVVHKTIKLDVGTGAPQGLIDTPGLPGPVAPIFPARVFDIRDFGAISDDAFDCTSAIADAIRACGLAGGGRVLIPAGKWFTGPIHLRSHIELHLEKGAVVRFSSSPAHYLPAVFVRWSGQECFNFSPLIYARNCENIGITGAGTLLGQGAAWWPWEKRERTAMARLYQMVLNGAPVSARRFGRKQSPLRPQFIMPINCRNVLLEDFSVLEGGPFWTIHLAYCDDVTIRRLRIDAAEGPNNDGIVLDSCRSVLVEDCDLKTKEDCISLKSGLNEDGQRVGKPTENVVIRRIHARGGAGAIAIGSDMSGGVRNVLVHDCTFDGPAIGIRLKAARGRGGVVENVEMRNLTMGTITGDAIQVTTEYPVFVSPNGKAPVFKNITFRDVTCAKAGTAARMIGQSDSALRQITLERVRITAEQGLHCSFGNGIHLLNVDIRAAIGPVFSLRDSQNVIIDGLDHAHSNGAFLDLRGRQTRQIALRSDNDTACRPAVVLGLDVPKDALLHE